MTHQQPVAVPAPGAHRFEQRLTAAERAQLEACLDDNRDEVAGLLVGLTEAEARTRLVASATTLLGLVKHAAFVERVWFQVSLAGRSRAEVGVPESADDSFALDDADTVSSVGADFRLACEQSRQVAAGHGLDDHALHNRRGPLSLRWIHLQVVQELARHAGHGDILREQLLARRAEG